MMGHARRDLVARVADHEDAVPHRALPSQRAESSHACATASFEPVRAALIGAAPATLGPREIYGRNVWRQSAPDPPGRTWSGPRFSGTLTQ